MHFSKKKDRKKLKQEKKQEEGWEKTQKSIVGTTDVTQQANNAIDVYMQEVVVQAGATGSVLKK